MLRHRPPLTLGTLGHFGCGKSSLVAAITRWVARREGTPVVDVDFLNRGGDGGRERSRNSRWVRSATAQHDLAVVDCPGDPSHGRIVWNAAVLMDVAILVVSAEDGVQAQTREHLVLAKYAGVAAVVVFVNRVDRVAAADRDVICEVVEVEVRAALSTAGFDGDVVEFVYGSAALALADDESELGTRAVERLLELVDRQPVRQRSLTAPFRLSVHDVFRIYGRGVVVTGVVEQGSVTVGDGVVVHGLQHAGRAPAPRLVLPTPWPIVVREIHSFRAVCSVAAAGDAVGLFFAVDAYERGTWRELPAAALRRGHLVAADDDHNLVATHRFVAHLRTLTPAEGGRAHSLRNGFQAQMLVRTASVQGRLGTETPVAPGEDADVDIEVESAICLSPGLVVREGHRTVAVGKVSTVSR